MPVSLVGPVIMQMYVSSESECIAWTDETRQSKAFAGLLKRYFGKLNNNYFKAFWGVTLMGVTLHLFTKWIKQIRELQAIGLVFQKPEQKGVCLFRGQMRAGGLLLVERSRTDVSRFTYLLDCAALKPYPIIKSWFLDNYPQIAHFGMNEAQIAVEEAKAAIVNPVPFEQKKQAAWSFPQRLTQQ